MNIVCVYIYIPKYVCMHISKYVRVYMYIEREREREKKKNLRLF